MARKMFTPKRCFSSEVCAFAAAMDHSNPSKHSEPGSHLYQSASGRHGRYEKRRKAVFFFGSLAQLAIPFIS